MTRCASEPCGILARNMMKPVWIAGAVGFFVGLFWCSFWLLVPVRDVQLHSRGVQFVAILAMVTCPPFLLQFTFLAPFLNAAFYGFVAVLWVGLRNRVRAGAGHRKMV